MVQKSKRKGARKDLKGRYSKKQRLTRLSRLGKRAQSEMGKIMKPITIQNNGDIMKAVQRIMAGPLTLIVVMADWCGHCKDLKPKYDNVMANSRHTIQNVAIDETYADAFNKALTSSIPSAKPLEVKGFPSLLLLDKNGTVKSAVPNDIPIIKSTTENLGNAKLNTNENTKAPSKLPMASNQTNSTTPNSVEQDEDQDEDIPISQNAIPSPRPVIKVKTEEYQAKSMNKNVKSPSPVNILSPTPISKTVASNSLVASPPLPEQPLGSEGSSIPDADVTVESRNSPAQTATKEGQQGGSLYGSIASAAYKLAPPAVLMAAAAAMMKRNKNNKTKKNRRSKR
jgi:thiol-disulfide isomerase/thioredoxin